MKYLIYVAVAIGLIYVGIKYFAGSGPSTQVTETVGKLKQSEVKALSAKSASHLIQMRAAVQNFRVTEGRLPSSLQELKEYDYIGSVPRGLSYDSSTGDISESQ